MARQIRTEIDIRAPAEQVWAILTDFASYPSWNPFVRRIEGSLTPGARLQVSLARGPSSAWTFRPRLLAAVPPRELRWLGSLGVRGLFDGEHAFELRSDGPERTHFTQSETFRGVLVPLVGHRIATETEPQFRRMNEALRDRAEAAH